MQFGLKNRILICIVGILVMIWGYVSYQKLPIDAFPDVSPNLVQIFTVTEGLAPEEIEQYVTYPVETAMNGLPGIEKIRSVSNFGLSVVNVYFKDNIDLYFARQLVGERIQETREQIPEGFGDPKLGPIATGMGLILFYYLEDDTGKRSLAELRSIQDWLVKFHLQTVPGVTEVLGIGGFEKQFHIEVHPHKLSQFGVSLSELIEKVKANNRNVGAQFIEKNSEEYIVRSVGLASSVDDLQHIVLKAHNGTPVYLKRVASIKTGGAIRRGLQTRNGVEEVVAGMVVKLFGTNSSTVIGQVEKRMTEINKILPDGVRLVPYYEQKTLVESCIKTVRNALLQGIVLVVAVLFAFMGSVRPSIVVALSIPFSVLFAFIGMWYFNISANLMSFGGLAIAIGMMVDGTIVMVENVDRLVRESSDQESPIHVISRACLEVAKPIVFAIMIVIVVFIPLFTMQGVEGKMFRPLAYTIALSMLGSLIFAILAAPVLSYLLKVGNKNALQPKKKSLFLNKLKDRYQGWVGYFVGHRKKAVTVSIALLIIGAGLFPFLGSEFTPSLQEGTIVLNLSMAPSISLTESKRMTLLVEKRLKKIPEIETVTSRVGRGEVGAHADPINSAHMFILLKPKKKWRVKTQAKLVSMIRKELGNVPGVLTNFSQPIAMNIDELLEGVKAELAIKLFGDDMDTLKQTADRISDTLRQVKGASDVQVDQVGGTPQLLITINRKSAAKYGLNIDDVQETIHAAIGGEKAGQIFEGIKRFDIVVRFPKSFRDNKVDIGRLLIRGPNGEQIPLSKVSDIREIIGPRQITRENNQRFISIQCNVNDRDIGSFVAEAQTLIDREVDLPPGYLVKWGGQFRLQEEANKRFMVVIPLTLALIFFLLFFYFNSIKNTVLILLNIPLALVGGVIALFITGQNLSVPASVGFIALFGIALGNGMVLVTYLNDLMRQGLDVDRVSIEGAMLRARPVL
ncbi:MAG: efflux RND transporter permease subunit, partial [Candidatus Margulisbacteria bacterium]|nr:efflux RND transporter permease subunit [Candidatus Margulisiibacteriota bacterium]